MSVAQVTEDTVVEAVAAGKNTLDRLAAFFGALATPTSHLTRTVDGLLAAEKPRLRIDEHGHLHTVGHDLLEDLEKQ